MRNFIVGVVMGVIFHKGIVQAAVAIAGIHLSHILEYVVK